MVGVGLEPSSGFRVRKKRKETTIIEVNTIYSPELLNGWDLHMARPRKTETQTEQRRKDAHGRPCTHGKEHTLMHHRPQLSLKKALCAPSLSSSLSEVLFFCFGVVFCRLQTSTSKRFGSWQFRKQTDGDKTLKNSSC